jgi:hypothetical protein
VCPCNNMLRPETAELWKHRHSEIRRQRARDASVWIISSDVTGEHDGRISYGPTEVIDAGGMVVDQVPLMTTGMIVVEFCATERSAPSFGCGGVSGRPSELRLPIADACWRISRALGKRRARSEVAASNAQRVVWRLARA